MSLIFRWSSASKLIDAYDIQYDKADKATDLSYVKKVYDDLPIFGYDLYDYNALFYAEITNGLQENYSKYIYKYYNIDSSKCKATLYYALRSDEKPVVVTDLNVTFEREETKISKRFYVIFFSRILNDVFRFRSIVVRLMTTKSKQYCTKG